MRLFALLAGFSLCLSSTSCQSYGDSSDYIPLATPVPPQLSQPVSHALPRPANFPTRPVAIPSSAPRTPRCASACVMDALTGKVLFSHNGLQHRQVASTQKLVTAMVVMEHGSLDKKVVIQPSDTKADPTKLGFRAGEVYSRRELLNAMMIRSFNDVALALARDTAAFVYPVFIPVTQGFWVSSLLVFLNRSVLPLARVKAYWRLQIILRSSGLRYT